MEHVSPQPPNFHVEAATERLAALRSIRDRHSGGASSTQRARLLAALQSLRYVSTFEAMRYLDIFDPRPRKLELVREGYPIVTLHARVETESGSRHRIGVYFFGTCGDLLVVPERQRAFDWYLGEE